ncbi:TonB-dependent receptor [Neolewinella lacunae]|uniref:TonB-dependent receptor n=1 Tax=Neolewinella lacunae TaxID=1517758 RepID=A0A923T930_9BACT|nr:TonB-dependent receptor [Neolewinella lacunae]MBC6995139.1 TonB-dependent receptor [Neolewinella lacunae]MDN3634089.1 TonB-dependent receptor [Neolewinella lacunae]
MALDFTSLGRGLALLFILFFTSVAVAQTTLSGSVLDTDQEPLIGATVTIKGTGTGTVTDLNGDFTLQAAADDVLVITYTGYQTFEQVVGNQTNFEIVLQSSTAELTEVVVVGYGTQRRRDLTGAVASAPLEAFREAPNTNILQSLNGTVPGLVVGQSTAAGEDASIQIRGQNSINGNTAPLIVLDGIIYAGRITDINPNDIASVDVLKDPSSKAIYGAQAANGVILITSKTGRGARKPSISYSGNYTTQNPTQDRRLLSREDYLLAARDVDYLNGYVGPDFTQINPDWTPENDAAFFAPILAGLANGTDFDWLGATQQNGFITDHSLSVSGATDKTTYFISGGYTDQQGIVLNDNYNRKTARVNLSVDVTDWLTIGTNSFGSFADYSGTSPSIGNVTSFSPLAAPRDADGNFIINPLGDNVLNPLLASDTDDRDIRNRLVGIFFGEIKFPFIPGLSYRVNYSNNYRFETRQNASVYEGGLSGAAFKNNNSTYDWTLNNILNYQVPLGPKHGLILTGVLERRRISFESTSARGVGFTNLGLSFNDLAQARLQFVESSAFEESFSSQMFRLAYDFQNRYLFTATARRDGFSGFAANNRSAVFPSASIGWVISEEGFMADNQLFDFLKLRVGYGINGNLTNRYSSLARILAGEDNRYIFGDGGQTLNGQGIQSLANPNLKWERTAGFNFGLDFAAVDGRISGNLDLYNSNTTDLLFNLVLPGITGFTSITSNVGEIKNNGIELNLNLEAIRKDNFNWTVGLNVARNRNEIVSLLGFDNDGDGREDDLTASGLFIGQPINTIFDYQVEGIYQLNDEIPAGYAPGTYRLRDVNGDGMITPDDRTVLGSSDPGFTLGLRNSISYGDFTFRFFFNAVQGGNDFYLGNNEALGVLTPGLAQSQNWYADIDYWSPNNPGATYRLPGTNTPFNGSQYFSRSFVRLQDVSLAYNLSKSLTEQLGLSSLKVFIAGKNLWTITDWEGWDPETDQGLNDSRPLLGGYSFGINVSF